MKKLFVIFIFVAPLLSFSLSNVKEAPGGVCSRINYFFELKKVVAEKHWPSFNSKILFGPVLFHSPDGLYVINPDAKLSSKLNYTVFTGCSSPVLIGIIHKGSDLSRFNMQVEYDEDDSTLLHYFNPVASVTDLVTAKKYVPAIQHTEEWAGMILHETFHQYQTSFDKFRECQSQTQKKLHRDTLLALHEANEWYRNSTRQEYDLLLQAVNADQNDSIKQLVKQFLDTREKRHARVEKTFGLQIKELEDMLERSEGVARYMEYCLKRSVKYISPAKFPGPSDSLYQPGAYANYDIKGDPFLDKYSKNYVYATGLTLARLLEKMNIDFKSGMYRDNITFETYLTRLP